MFLFTQEDYIILGFPFLSNSRARVRTFQSVNSGAPCTHVRVATKTTTGERVYCNKIQILVPVVTHNTNQEKGKEEITGINCSVIPQFLFKNRN